MSIIDWAAWFHPNEFYLFTFTDQERMWRLGVTPLYRSHTVLKVMTTFESRTCNTLSDIRATSPLSFAQWCLDETVRISVDL